MGESRIERVLRLRDFTLRVYSSQVAFPHFGKLIYLSLICLLSTTCFLFTVVHAESRNYLGLSLSYDELSEVDSTNSRLIFEGKTFLIPTAEIDTALMQQCLRSQQCVRKLSLEALLILAKNASVKKDENLVDLSISALSLHPKFDLEASAELMAMVAGDAVAQSALKRVILDKEIFNALSPAIRVSILFEIGLADLTWLREKALGALLVLKAEFKVRATSSFSETIQTRRFERLALIAALLREVLGVDDPQFQEARLVADQVTQFQVALLKREVPALEIVLLSLGNNENFKDQLYPYLIEEIHRAAREDIDKDQPLLGLKLLTLVDLSYRTATTHSLVKIALAALDEKDLSSLNEIGVRQFLFSLAQFDVELTSAVERRFEESFYLLLKKENFSQVDRTLESILTIRPDPNRKNDKLRINYAKKLRDAGLKAQSDLQLDNIKTGVPWLLKLEFFSEDTLGTSLSMFVLEMFGVFLVLVFLLNRWRKATQVVRARIQARRELEASRAETEEMPRGSSVQGPVFRRMDKMSPERSEYNRLLMFLGLPPSADYKEIRSAYRRAVKTHHPDMQSDTQKSGMVSDKFVDLNQTYERILQLRELMGLREDQ